jgi:hypothetical protein
VKVINFFSYIILLIPLWWVLGLNLIVCQALVLAAFFILLIKQKLAFPKITIFLIIFICIYFYSILNNLHKIPSNRLIASLYNLSNWVMGFLIIVIIYNSLIHFKHILRLSKSFMIFGTICGLLSFIGVILYLSGYDYVEIAHPLVKFLSNITDKNPLLGDSLKIYLLRKDYVKIADIVGDIVPRVALFFGWPVNLGMVFGVTIPFTFFYYKLTKRFLTFLFSFIFQLVALFFSQARIVFVGLVVSFFLVYNFTEKNKKLKKKVILFLIGILLFYLVFFTNFISEFIYFRLGSFESRLNLYYFMIETTLSEKPLFGFGFKPREEGIDIPLASHSTYLSNFFKTGLIGICLLILFWFSVYLKWRVQVKLIKESKLLLLMNILGLIFFQGLIWQLTEDIDSALFLPFFYFIAIGLIISVKNLSGVVYNDTVKK